VQAEPQDVLHGTGAEQASIWQTSAPAVWCRRCPVLRLLAAHHRWSTSFFPTTVLPACLHTYLPFSHVCLYTECSMCSHCQHQLTASWGHAPHPPASMAVVRVHSRGHVEECHYVVSCCRNWETVIPRCAEELQETLLQWHIAVHWQQAQVPHVLPVKNLWCKCPCCHPTYSSNDQVQTHVF
jgi:hypothetical protein